MERAAHDYLRRVIQQGLLSENSGQRLSPLLQKQNDALVVSGPAVQAENWIPSAMKPCAPSALRGLLRDGVISESSYALLLDEVDTALMQEDLSWPEIREGRD